MATISPRWFGRARGQARRPHPAGALLPLAVGLIAACGPDDRLGEVAARDDSGEGAGVAVIQVATPAGLAPSAARGLRAAIVASIQQKAGWAYHVEPSEAGFSAKNPAQKAQVDFTSGGVRLSPSDGGAGWSFTLTPVRYGCEADLRPVPRTSPEASANRVEYRRGHGGSGSMFVEWYVNGPLGLEQGFTLPAAPPCVDGGEEPSGGRDLVIELELGGGLSAAVVDEGQAVELTDGSGTAALRYKDLYVVDAEARALPGRLGAEGDRITIHVGAGGAVFPVTVDPLITLLASGEAADDALGYAVAISGATAVVGAYGADDPSSDTGSAYVFERIGGAWTPGGELVPSDSKSASDHFGAAVAVSGDTMVVGAVGDDDNGTDSGSAYVFTRDVNGQWIQQAKLLSSDGAAGDYFGASVAASGDTVVVGAPGAGDPGSDSGAAYVFARQGTVWDAGQPLPAEALVDGDAFGSSVAVWSDTAVVGARGDAEMGAAAGAVYVFTRGASWSLSEKLLGQAGDWFGCSVAVWGDTVAVGAHQHGDSGEAYVFGPTGAGWELEATLSPDDGASNDHFGYSVALSSDTVVVGAPDDNTLGNSAGSAYVFLRSGSSWLQGVKLFGGASGSGEKFGYAVALSNESALVGALYEDIASANSGSAYVVTLLSNGELCDPVADVCKSGFCVDGTCCDTACTDACSACTAAKKGSGEDGVCGGVEAGTDPDGECIDGSADTCGSQGVCDGAGMCEQQYPIGAVCAAATCASATTLNLGGLCDENGGCADGGAKGCGNYACSGDACLSSCASDADCAPTASCSAAACLPKEPSEVGCSDSTGCPESPCAGEACAESGADPGSFYGCSHAPPPRSRALPGPAGPVGLLVLWAAARWRRSRSTHLLARRG